MQSAKETAANIAASAKAGMEKTKATVQEKAEKMTSRDPLQKEMATEKKEARIHEAEREKHESRAHNAAATGAGTFGHGYTTGGSYTTTGTTRERHPTAAGYTAEGAVHPQGTTTTTTTTGVVGSQYPAGTNIGGAGRVGHQDPNAGTGGYGAGSTY